MEKNFIPPVKLKFTLFFSFFTFIISAQTDYSHLKFSDPDYKRIPENFTPGSKYGKAVTLANLKEALKNPDEYLGANFNNAGLTTVPEEIFLFPNLVEIDLSHNSISSLPARFDELKNLRDLYLNNNRLTSLNVEITSCNNLEILQIQNNPLVKISREIGNMKGIKELWIEGTDKKCIVPVEIWNLKKLQKLRLINVNLQSIPSGISGLIQLNEICLSHNSISSFPNEIFELKKLTYLNLGYNVIASVPSSIKNLKNLDYFGIYGNPVSSLPHEIQELKKLSFLSCWNTSLPKEEIAKVKNALPGASVYDTDNEIH